MDINPQRLELEEQLWKEGFALDLHTKKGFFNNMNSRRTSIGRAMYKVKYLPDKSDEKIIKEIAFYASDKFLRKRIDEWKPDLIIPIPPSICRELQPVKEIAIWIGRYCDIQVEPDILVKKKETTPLKDITDPVERKKELADAFEVSKNDPGGENILLFDDIYGTGATLIAACEVLLNTGNVKNIYVLTITKKH